MANAIPAQQAGGAAGYPTVEFPHTSGPQADPAHQTAQTSVPQPTAPQPVPTSSPSAPAGPAPEAQTVVDALIRLYTSKDMKVKDAVVDEFYAPSATFVDNAVQVSGHRNIKVQFHALGKMFKTVKVEPSSSSMQQQDGQHVLKVQNVQEYALGPTVITFNVDTTLLFDSTGKIQKHSDVWQGQWSNFGFCKRFVGSTSSMLMRLVRV